MQKEIPTSELDWFDNYIASVRWREAKSKESPHSYTVRDWHPETFEQAVMLIRAHGVAERFWNQTYIYFHYEGLKYWTMGFPIEETIIINRAPADSKYGFE